VHSFLNSPEQRIELFRLIVFQLGIDPGDVSSIYIESEVLVFQRWSCPAILATPI
jgi:hypothetical protein